MKRQGRSKGRRRGVEDELGRREDKLAGEMRGVENELA